MFHPLNEAIQHVVIVTVNNFPLKLFLSLCMYMYVTEGSLRLVTNYAGETSYGFSRVAPTHGLLEIYMQGQWGTVCINNFDDTAANIACQSLGFTGVYHHEIAVFLG